MGLKRTAFTGVVDRVVQAIRAALPEGRPLPEDVWRRRHQFILWLLWLQAVAIALYALVAGYGIVHSLLEGGAVAAMAVLAGSPSRGRKFRSVVASIGLVTCSAFFVHVSGGFVEMHFHFFVMVIIIALYQDWLPFLVAIGYVVLHHGVVGVLDPVAVYNHPDAWAHPWKWAAIHGGFVLAASAASIAGWRLNESARARTELALNSAGEGIYGLDRDGRLMFVNPAAARMLGTTVDELLGGSSGRELLPGARPAARSRRLDPTPIQNTIRDGLVQHVSDVVFRRKDGTTFPAEYVSAPITERGAVVGAVVTFTDNTRRQQAQDALTIQKEQLRMVLDTNPNLIFVKEEDGTFVLVNKAVADLYGTTVEELVGRTDADFNASGAEVEHFLRDDQEVIATRQPKFIAEEPVTDARSGEVNWFQTIKVPLVSADGQHCQVLGVSTNVTERKHAAEALNHSEQQLRQAQKMEAIGQLAGGVAHDFNNLLTVITGFSQLLQMQLEPGDPRSGYVEQIAQATDHAAALTQQLLAFSRRQVLRLEVMDLNVVVSESEKMLCRLIGEDIELTTVLRPGLGQVQVDRGQIQQVILNLAVNARDAMPEGGKLTLETAHVELDATYAQQHPGMQPGRYVMLAVSDTGCGMDAEVQSHLFEPFFTTKEVGKGTGLGLSTVYGIVKQSGGHIWVYSEPGGGTTFKVYLPRLDSAVELREDAPAPAAPLTGTETILVVEDEDQVRSLVRQVLQASGYTVLEAHRGDAALSISNSYDGPIDLLVTDVVMPGMSGREVAQRLETLRPGLPVLYISGYTDHAIVHHGVLEAGITWLQKPFTPIALARKVREMLDAPR